MRPRRQSPILLVLILAIAVASVYYLNRTDFGNASKVIQMPDLTPAGALPEAINPTSFEWLDSRRVIITQDAPMYLGTRHRGPATHTLSILDTTAKDPLKTLAPLSGVHEAATFGFIVSPDTDRLLTHSVDGPLSAVPISNNPTTRSTQTRPARLAWWKIDASGWYEWVPGAVDQASIWFTPIAGDKSRKIVDVSTKGLNGLDLIGPDSSGGVLIRSSDASGYKLEVLRFGLDGQMERLTVPPDVNDGIFSASTSPDGRSIGWLYSSTQGRLHTLNFALTDDQCGGFRVISKSLPFHQDTPDINSWFMNSLRWRHDSRAVGVLYRGKLYIIPVS